MVQKVNFNNLTGDSLTIGNTTISGTGVTVGGAPLAAGATQYANTSQLPKTNLNFGEFALVGNTLYITNSVGWYSVALINQSPSLNISVSDISLGATGNTINFTYTASDPDGPEPTVTLETTANTSQANITLHTSNNTVTVENLSATDYSANITLTATDGIDQTFGTVTLTVVYLSELWDETVLSIGTSSTNGLDNSTFIDRSTNAHTVTPSGSPAQTAFHPYLDNWSVEFDGSSYLSAASDSAFAVGSSTDFTVECWYQHATQSYPYPCIATFGSNGSGWAANVWHIIEHHNTLSPNNLAVIAYNQNSSGQNLLQATSTFVVGEWYHIAVTRSGSIWTLYINGTAEDTATWSGNLDGGISADLLLGDANTGNTDNNLVGKISNFRFVKDVVYSTTFTPSTQKLTAITNTTFLGCQSNRFIDNSSSNHAITVAGNTKISAFNPFGQGSEYAVGENKGSYYRDNDSYLSVADPNNDFHLNNEQFTIEFWYYRTNSDDGCLVSKWASGYSGYRINASGTGVLGFYNVTTAYGCSALAPLNAWTHYACTRDASGNMRQFINGVLDRTDSVNPDNASGSTPLYIGTLHLFQSQGLNQGYISDFSLVKGTAKYTADFTPPTSPIGNTNATAYIPMDNAGIFDKTGNSTLTLVGNTATSTVQNKYADTAMYFDGTGDYAEFNLPAIGTNDFTIEGWVYFSTIQSSYIFDCREVATGTTHPALDIQNDWKYIANNTYVISSGVTPSANQWYHFAVVRSSGTTTLYIDGTSIGSAADSRSYLANPTANIGIFRTKNTAALHGYIENFQILNGVAKYTSNFTPPTRTQGITYQAES